MDSIEVGQTILIYSSVIVIFLIGGFLTKLLYDLSKLTQSARGASELLQNELEPTLKELKEAAGSLKSIANTADTHILGLKDVVSKALEKSSFVGNKFKSLFQGLAKGIICGINLFKK